MLIYIVVWISCDRLKFHFKNQISAKCRLMETICKIVKIQVCRCNHKNLNSLKTQIILSEYSFVKTACILRLPQLHPYCRYHFLAIKTRHVRDIWFLMQISQGFKGVQKCGYVGDITTFCPFYTTSSYSLVK